MKLKKAIIAVAGYGTRRLPITKSIEKCMLPIGNRPVVDYLVQDCIRNGITDIIFVVGEQHEQIKQYYSGHNEQLEEHLSGKNKTAELEMLKSLSRGARFRYVIQDRFRPYGTAVTLSLCADLLKEGEQFLFLAGDDFMFNPGGQSSVEQLISAVTEKGSGVALLGHKIDPSEVSHYGVIETEGDHFVRIVEKPSVDEAPSNIINISKYVFNKKVADNAVHLVENTQAESEYLLTDAINMSVAQGEKVLVVTAEGEYLDGGTLEGWLHANNQILAHEMKVR